MFELDIIPAQADDVPEIFELYRKVAAQPGGLARLQDEISEAYVAAFVAAAQQRGLSLLARQDARLVGEIHAYSAGIFCFEHVLTELTIAIHPDVQGAGLGRRLFTHFLDVVVNEMTHINRVELISRESNQRAISFYRSLGFAEEGRLRQRIRNPDGSLEDDVPMAWVRSYDT